MLNVMKAQVLIKFIFLPLFLIFSFTQKSTEDIPSRSKISKQDLKNFLIDNIWVLTEFKTIKENSITDATLLLLPCEKDNYTNYYEDGTYTIFEADKKCEQSSNEKKGSGRWDLEEGTKTIFDEYQGGREIEKKILTLTERKLTLEFESEGEGRNILTFYTPEALEDIFLKEEVSDPRNYRNSLLEIIQVTLEEKNRYNLLKRSDFIKDGLAINRSISETFKRTVALYPLRDLTGSDDAQEYNKRLLSEKELIEQGKQLGVDYIITGTLTKVESSPKKNKYKSEVSFELDVIDLTSDHDIVNQRFQENYPDPLKEAGKTVLMATGFTSAAEALGYNYESWSRLADRIEMEDGVDDLDQIFSKHAGNRLDSLNKANSVLSAFQASTREVEKFIDQYLPIQIEVDTILTLDRKNFVRTIRLNAGKNRNLNAKDKLDIYEMEISFINGKQSMTPIQKIGEGVLESVYNENSSVCRVINGEEKITELIRHNKTLYAWTTEKKALLIK